MVLCSDLGGEYFLSKFIDFLNTHETIHQSSCSNTPAQNSRQRKRCNLLDITRSLLLSSSVPSVFWGEAVLIAAYLLNQMPSPLLTGTCPTSISMAKFPHVFGSACFVLLPKRDRTKLSAYCVLYVDMLSIRRAINVMTL